MSQVRIVEAKYITIATVEITLWTLLTAVSKRMSPRRTLGTERCQLILSKLNPSSRRRVWRPYGLTLPVEI